MNLAFNISLAGYLAALLLALAELCSRRRERLASVTIWTLVFAATAQTVWLALRWAAAGRAPFANMFESLALFAWTVVVVFLALQWRKRVPLMGAAAALLAVVTLGVALAFDPSVSPIAPALRSRWLAAHVLACFFGYGAMALAAVSGVAWLVLNRRSQCRACRGAGRPCPRKCSSGEATAGSAAVSARLATPAGLRTFESITDRAITFGFLLLTVGILSGAVWANSAWGSYWSWDPKETWAFITWLIYAGYLHCRHLRGWRGKRSAWVAVIGFASVLFTYVGVSFLMGGMHSYAK